MRKIKLLFTLCALLFAHLAVAQNTNIYVWDVTRSMIGEGTVIGVKTPNVYDKVEEYLIKDIEKISIPSTRIVVIPFQEDVLRDYIITADDATPESKRSVIAKIKETGPACFKLTHSRTNIAGPIYYALQNYQDKSRNDKVVVLTDGVQNMAGGSEALVDAIKEWNRSSDATDFMVYVLTTENAKRPIIEPIPNVDFTDTDRFTNQIETLNLTPSQRVDLNIKNDKSLKITFAKNSETAIPDGVEVTIKSEPGCPLRIDEKATIVGGSICLALQFDYETLKNQFPQEETYCKLQLDLVEASKIYSENSEKVKVVLTPSEVTLVIKNKKERVLKVELID
ncbi:MAG: VWA domain-containing protein [Alistipes sp.]|nr:VWA domain-containing protein [Alistipes sp.]